MARDSKPQDESECAAVVIPEGPNGEKIHYQLNDEWRHNRNEVQGNVRNTFLHCKRKKYGFIMHRKFSSETVNAVEGEEHNHQNNCDSPIGGIRLD
jgi:hypothetical protein